MGGVFKAIEKPFRTGASSQKRAAEEQARIQREQMEQQKKQFEQQQAENRRRLEEQQRQQEAMKNQSDLQSKLASDAAANAVDDTPDIQVGGELLDTGERKRKRKRMTGSSALGL